LNLGGKTRNGKGKKAQKLSYVTKYKEGQTRVSRSDSSGWRPPGDWCSCTAGIHNGKKIHGKPDARTGTKGEQRGDARKVRWTSRDKREGGVKRKKKKDTF